MTDQHTLNEVARELRQRAKQAAAVMETFSRWAIQTVLGHPKVSTELQKMLGWDT